MRRLFVGEEAFRGFQRFLKSSSPDFAFNEFGNQCAPAALSHHSIQLRSELFRNDDMHTMTHKPT